MAREPSLARLAPLNQWGVVVLVVVWGQQPVPVLVRARGE
jgi:hypothetical protein